MSHYGCRLIFFLLSYEIQPRKKARRLPNLYAYADLWSPRLGGTEARAPVRPIPATGIPVHQTPNFASLSNAINTHATGPCECYNTASWRMMLWSCNFTTQYPTLQPMCFEEQNSWWGGPGIESLRALLYAAIAIASAVSRHTYCSGTYKYWDRDWDGGSCTKRCDHWEKKSNSSWY